MANTEIKVDKKNLENNIQSLKNLLSGSGYSGKSKLIERGFGETHDSFNQILNDLKDSEKVLMELIEITVEALENGSFQFTFADNKAGEDISAIDGSLVGE